MSNFFSFLFDTAVKQKLEIWDLKGKLKAYGILPIDYSFLPKDWVEIPAEKLKTEKKYSIYNIYIPQALTDLLDSSLVSRRIALNFKNFVGTEEQTIMEVINWCIKNIYYITNQEQFKKLDLWTNGDTALISNKGDCDISVRAAIRVLKDVIYQNRLSLSPEHIFQMYGYYVDENGDKWGHSWMMIWTSKEFRIYEMTRDNPYPSAIESEPSGSYVPWFCHNNRKGWQQQEGWEMFL